MGSDRSWELVEAVARSPLLQEATVARGIDLAGIERTLLELDEIEAHERERLLLMTRELAAFAARHRRRLFL
jgi:hypothetical protein